MSRAKHSETLHAVQLFPFVAVLLCTMGSLLVLLVSVARSSKDRAVEEAVAARAEARAAVAAKQAETRKSHEAIQRELAEFAKAQSKFDAARKKAAEQLHEDQARLSHLDDHIRRLREQLDSLKLAAAELNAMEGDHVDDRKQAQQEIERMERLIAETRSAIEQLRAESKRSKSYAIIPYQGRRGTFRRPIYIECTKQAVILQPEGVVFTLEDFRQPIGPGNALVAALRAAKEHIIQNESDQTAGKQAEPYPLIIVRPQGIVAYYLVRTAIQSWDDEFGYEIVEEDWKLQYAAADPRLADKEQEAAQLARGRLRALAAAAPQAYGAYRSESDWGGSDDDMEEDPDELDRRRASSAPVDRVQATVQPGSDRVAVLQKPAGTPSQTIVSPPRPAGATVSDDRYASTTTPPPRRPPNSSPSSTPPDSMGGRPNGKPQSGSYIAGDTSDEEFDDLARKAAADKDGDETQKRPRQKTRGKNWALANGRPGMIPVRRTIQIVVRDDAVAILPDASPTSDASSGGREFQFGNLPGAAYEDLLNTVEKRIKDWGMAGQGLYWRPVVDLKVSPEGEYRVDELTRLLKHSGVEIRSGDVAQHDEESAHASR